MAVSWFETLGTHECRLKSKDVDVHKHQAPALGTGTFRRQSHARGWQSRLFSEDAHVTSCAAKSPQGSGHLLPPCVPCPSSEELLCRGKGYIMQLLVLLLLLATKILLHSARAGLERQGEGDSSGPPVRKGARSWAASSSRSRVPAGSGAGPGTAAPGQGALLRQHGLGRLQATAKAAAWERLPCV